MSRVHQGSSDNLDDATPRKSPHELRGFLHSSKLCELLIKKQLMAARIKKAYNPFI